MTPTVAGALFSLLIAAVVALTLWSTWRSTLGTQRYRVAAIVALLLLLALVTLTRIGAQEDVAIQAAYDQLLTQDLGVQVFTTPEYTRLARRMEERAMATGNASYWYMLGQDQRFMQDHAKAARYFELAADGYPNDPSILAAWAESQFLANGYRLDGQVEELSQRVLRLDPLNQTVLGLLGVAAFQAAEYESAIRLWSRALSAIPPTSPNAQVIRDSIARARDLAGTDTSTPASNDSSAAIELFVALAPEAGVVPGDTSVFVFARAPGSRMPLAVTRLTAADLPGQVRLDDSMVMVPGTSLLTLPVLELVARVSWSGQAVPESGDIEAVVEWRQGEANAPIELLLRDRLP